MLNQECRTLGLALALTGVVGLPLIAQEWTVDLTAAAVGQDVSGSDDSFRSQLNLDEGFHLEELRLEFEGGGDSGRVFTLEAWGFGDAEPARGAQLGWRPASDWQLDFGFRRSESIFALAETELGLRRDDWHITRVEGRVTWDGWDPARLSLGVGWVERGGQVTQPFRELDELYLLGVDLDESRQETWFRLETRDLPVDLTFEQSFAQLERENGYFAAAERNLDGDDPDILVDAANEREEERDIPVSRLTAVWGSERVELAGAFLWSDADLDVLGASGTFFGLQEGRVGTAGFVDDLVGAASFDAFAAQVRVGIRLAAGWTLRLDADRRDRSQDANLLGDRILRLTNARGESFDIPQAIDESTFFDVDDAELRAELEYDAGDWSVWFGGFDASREVGYRLVSDGAPFDVERTSDGWSVGAAWDGELGESGRGLEVSAELEQGTFEEFVFRTDPEDVDRLTLKLAAELARGWKLRLRGRFEEADNPPEVSSLDRSSDAWGAGLFWLSDDGESDFGIDLDWLDLRSETALFFIDESLRLTSPDFSLYDLSIQTLSVHGRTVLGAVTLAGSAVLIEDDGATWPLESWSGRLRVGYATSEHTEVSVFGQVFSYDEDLATSDDFDVTRYGVAFSWRSR